MFLGLKIVVTGSVLATHHRLFHKNCFFFLFMIQGRIVECQLQLKLAH